MQRPVLPRCGWARVRCDGLGLVTPIGSATTIVKGGASVNFNAMMILLPERRLGLVVLMNANKGLDSALGDQRLPMLPYNVAEMLLGQPPTVFPADPKPTLLYAILFLAVDRAGGRHGAHGAAAAPLAASGRSSARKAGRAVALRLGLPLLLNLGWGLFALVGVPTLFGMPLSHIIYAAPDFGYDPAGQRRDRAAVGRGADGAHVADVPHGTARGIACDWHTRQGMIGWSIYIIGDRYGYHHCVDETPPLDHILRPGLRHHLGVGATGLSLVRLPSARAVRAGACGDRRHGDDRGRLGCESTAGPRGPVAGRLGLVCRRHWVARRARAGSAWDCIG